MSDTQYTCAVARIRVLEGALFSASTIDQLMACRDEESALKFLVDRGWGGADIPLDADAILAREHEKTWETIRDLRVEMSVFDILSWKDLFHNLKAAIREVCTGKSDVSIFYEGTKIPGEELTRIIRERDFGALPENMQKAAREATEALLHAGDGQLCDVIIDRAFMDAVMTAGRASKEDVICQYAESTVATADIRIAVRSAKTGKSWEFMKRALAPCGSLNVDLLAQAALSGADAVLKYLETCGYGEGAEALKISPSAFERWCDDRIIQSIRPQKYNAFSVGPLVAYVLARENEIKTVRIILTGKQNGLPDDFIRERIREMYG